MTTQQLHPLTHARPLAGSRKLASQRGGGAAQHLSKSHVALPLVTATPPLVNGAVEAVDGPVAPNMPASTSMPNLQAANRGSTKQWWKRSRATLVQH